MSPGRPRLTPQEHDQLYARTNVRPALYVATLAVSLSAIVVAPMVYPSLATYAAAVLLIGALQHQLSVVQHEANHYLLFTNRRINEIGGALSGGMVGFAMDYRRIHAEHHRSLGSATDPDLPNYVRYPRSPSGFLLDLLKGLSGYAAVRQVIAQSLSKQKAVNAAKGARNGFIWVVLIQMGIFGAFAATGHWLNYFVLWILPLVTVGKTLAQCRNIAEHTLVIDKGNAELSRYRTFRCNWVEGFFFAPMHFNYHAEHHFFPGIPYSNLPAAHRILSAKAAYADIVEVERSYVLFLLTKALGKGRARSVIREPQLDQEVRAASHSGGEG